MKLKICGMKCLVIVNEKIIMKNKKISRRYTEQQDKHQKYVVGNFRRIFNNARKKEITKDKLIEQLETAKQTQSYQHLNKHRLEYVNGYITASLERHSELINPDRTDMGNIVYWSGNIFEFNRSEIYDSVTA